MAQKPSAKMMISSLLSFVVVTAIQVWAWGDLRSFFAHPARLLMAAVFLGVSVATVFSGMNMSAGKRVDKRDALILIPITVLTAAATVSLPYMDRRDIWTFDGDAARYTGLLVITAGGVLRVWPFFVLGRRFSGLVAIQENHTLVTDGIYRTIRNPSYLGVLVTMLGWAFIFRGVLGLALTALYVPLLIIRIHDEERMLASEFGEEYAASCKRTWRLVPFVY